MNSTRISNKNTSLFSKITLMFSFGVASIT
jgi:hypothetical protein